jgi:UDP-2,3-diacylglucosamine hydrolase
MPARVVVVADAHLGQVDSPEAATFHAFLAAVPQLGDALLINGDSSTSVQHGAAFMALFRASRLHELRRSGILITFIGGNHDRWGNTFFTRDLGIAFYPGQAELEIAGRAAFVAHGDGLTEQHWAAKLMHRLTRHPATIGLFRALHPDLGFPLADRLSRRLGDHTRDGSVLDRAAQAQALFARALLARRPELGLVILAHTHRAALERQPDGRAYLNPGAWLDGYRYAVVTKETVELKQFDPRGVTAAGR